MTQPDHADISDLRQAIAAVAATQERGVELHARTYNELRAVADTLSLVHKQVIATNGRVTVLEQDVSGLQESAQWRAGAVAVPRAAIAILKQQRVLQAVIALAVLLAGVINLPPWAGNAIEIVLNALAATPTPTP